MFKKNNKDKELKKESRKSKMKYITIGCLSLTVIGLIGFIGTRYFGYESNLKSIDSETYLTNSRSINPFPYENYDEYEPFSKTNVGTYNFKTDLYNSLFTTQTYNSLTTENNRNSYWLNDYIANNKDNFLNENFLSPTNLQSTVWIGNYQAGGRAALTNAGFIINPNKTSDVGAIKISNKWYNIREYLDDYINSSTGYLRDDRVSYSTSSSYTWVLQENWRWRDYFGVDLINNLNGYNSFVGQGIGKEGSFGNLNYDDLKNQTGSISLKGLTTGTGSSQGIKTTSTVADISWENLFNISGVESFVSEKKQEIMNNYPYISESQIEVNITSLKVYIPYYLNSGSDSESFDTELVKIGITEFSAEFYINDNRTTNVNLLTNSMNQYFSNSINLETDDGASLYNGGIFTNNTTMPNGISSLEKFNILMNSSWNNIKISNSAAINSLGASFVYVFNQEGTIFDLYLIVSTGSNSIKKQAKLIKEGITISFEPSQEYLNWQFELGIKSRINLETSYVVAKNSENEYVYTPEDLLKQVSYKTSNNYISGEELENGAIYLFKSPIKINFSTTIQENEILYIDDNPIDVLNYNFYYSLEDGFTYATDPSTGEEVASRKNSYQIKIVQYNKDGPGGSNGTIYDEFEFTIIINSQIQDFDISYFAWSPENNFEQKQLINEYLLNSDGSSKLDDNGDPIINPNYDPYIDPKTGTKKQLVWVNKKVDSDYIDFLNDPLDENGNLNFDTTTMKITSNSIGFLAEAVVIPMGIKVYTESVEFGETFNMSYLGTKTNPNTELEITSFEIKPYGEGTQYFSKEGIYLLVDKDTNGYSTNKIVGYGTENNAYNNFTDIYPNQNENGWVPFWSSPAGVHLMSFLVDQINLSQEAIQLLSYQETSSYWIQYVNYIVSTKSNQSKIINPVLDTQAILDYAIQYTKDEFNPDDETLTSWLGEFTNKSITNVYYIKQDGDYLEFKFSLNSNNVNAGIDYTWVPNSILLNVVFKDSNELDPNKTTLNVLLNNSYIEETISTTTIQEFETNSDIFNLNDLFLDQSILGYINYNISYYDGEKTKIAINLWIKSDYEETYQLSQKLFLFNNTLLDSTSEFNIFKNFSEVKFNLSWRSLTTEEAKTKILEFILTKIDNDLYDLGYINIAIPTDEEFSQIINAVGPTTANPIQIIYKLEVSDIGKLNGYWGSKQLGIYNQLSELPSIVDLSSITLNPLVYNYDSPEELSIAVIEAINEQLSIYNMTINVSVKIDDFDALINMFFIKIGTKSINFKITSNEGFDLIGSTNVLITNTTNVSLPFDLNEIKLDNLEFQLTNSQDIANTIYNYLKINFFEKFEILETEISIFWNEKEISIFEYDFLRSLVDINPPSWTITQTISLKPNVNSDSNLIGQSNISIVNVSGSDIFNPDEDESWDPDIWNPNYKISDGISFAWFVPLMLIISVGIGYSGIFLYQRIKTKKIR